MVVENLENNCVNSYESGRIIIKETHPAISVYFIWYGTGQSGL